MILSKKEGNISLIMLFVLAIGSLIGLMSTNFIQDMISSTWSLRDFYQSYYISKWGIELWILAVNSYDYGFEDNLTGTEDIIKNNLHCKKNCNLSLKISSRIRPIGEALFWTIPEPIIPAQCGVFTKNKITLSWGSSYIIPLFTDERSLQGWDNSFKNLLEDGNYKLTIQSPLQDTAIGIGIALGWSASGFKYNYDNATLTWQQLLYKTGNITTINIYEFLHNSDPILPLPWWQNPPSIVQSFWASTNLLALENFNYLFITNLGENTYSFCLNAIQNTNGYALDNALVTSIASYGKTTIWLQANIKKPLPDYIVNSYDGIYNTDNP